MVIYIWEGRQKDHACNCKYALYKMRTETIQKKRVEIKEKKYDQILKIDTLKTQSREGCIVNTWELANSKGEKRYAASNKKNNRETWEGDCNGIIKMD